MVPMYKKGGKKSSKNKNSFIEKSKEITFGDKPMMKGYGGMKYGNGGLYSAAEKSENIARVKKNNSMMDYDHQTKVKKQTGGEKSKTSTTNEIRYLPSAIATSAAKKFTEKDKQEALDKIKKSAENTLPKESLFKKETQVKKQTGGPQVIAGGSVGTIKGKKEKNSPLPVPSKNSAMENEAIQSILKARDRANQAIKRAKEDDEVGGQAEEKKTGGKKSMEPGGGGRFAAMVGKLKGQGKSEGSAKAIAASIGRKKYGNKRFQEMAAAGRKGLGGMSDSTGANEAGMQMIKTAKKKKAK